jgi:hypothetical protein
MTTITTDMDTSTLEKTKEDFLLICLDANINDSSNSLPVLSLVQNLSLSLHLFTEFEPAMKFLSTIQYEQIILIVSGVWASQALSRTCKMRQVQDVLVFCCHPQDLREDLNKYSALVGIFTCQAELIASLEKTIAFIHKQVLTFSIFDQMQRPTKDLSRESNAFLWHQVLFYTLRHMPTDEQAKEEMLEICSSYHRQNVQEQRMIQQYRECQDANQAIFW